MLTNGEEERLACLIGSKSLTTKTITNAMIMNPGAYAVTYKWLLEKCKQLNDELKQVQKEIDRNNKPPIVCDGWVLDTKNMVWTYEEYSITHAIVERWNWEYLRGYAKQEWGIDLPEHKFELPKRKDPPWTPLSPQEVIRLLDGEPYEKVRPTRENAVKCPVHKTYMYYHQPSDRYACQTSDCQYSRGINAEQALKLQDPDELYQTKNEISDRFYPR